MEIQTGELPDGRGFRYEHPAASSNRRKCFRRLRSRWLAGVVVLATVIAILGLSSKEADLPVLEAGLYLLAGFGLLALTHLLRMSAGWKIDLVSIPARLADRWMSNAFAIIAAGLLVALLLPVGYAGFIRRGLRSTDRDADRRLHQSLLAPFLASSRLGGGAATSRASENPAIAMAVFPGGGSERAGGTATSWSRL